MLIKYCVTPEEIMATFPVMKQLRPALEEGAYLAMIMSLKESDRYNLAGLFDDSGKCVSVAGFRVNRLLYLGGEAQIYVDDLVTDGAERSKGYGTAIFDWLKAESKRLGCKGGIALDSGHARVEAHAFYAAKGMSSIAAHFYRPRSPSPEPAAEEAGASAAGSK